MSGKKNKRGIQIVLWKAKERMRDDLSKAQIKEFRRADPGEEDGATDARGCDEPSASVDIEQLANWSTHQSAQEVVRVSKEFYFRDLRAQ
jgi:hypothetical protein